MDNRTLASLLVAGILGILVLLRRRARKFLPPGPPSDPLIGHLRIIPQEKQADVFHEWAKTYGDVMYLEVPGRKMVVLDSVEVARTLLEERSSKYSCRPRFVVWAELMGWTSSLTFLPYGKEFLKHRKMIQGFFGKKEILAYDHILVEEARLLVKNLHESVQGDLLRYIHRLTVSNIVRATYGHQVKSDEDIFMQFAEVMANAAYSSGPIGNTPVDLFPWLRYFPSWFPGTYYATLARKQWYRTIREVHDVSTEFVQAEMKDKSVAKSFMSDHLERLAELEDQEGLTLEDIKGAAAAVFSAGQETSHDTLGTFIMAMLLNPEIQQRAYEEIITTVGHDRFPDLNDRESLPYLELIFQEVFRWHSPVPFGVPHRVQEDDVFNGMFIPKGTIVIPNIKGMSRDERIYADPLKFDPSRYLPAPEGRSEPRFPAMWGFGRRICPGRYFADMAVWHVMACVLATLEILPPNDEMGNVVIPEPIVIEGFASAFEPFKFEVRARSERARALIAEID
ncbi:cytochrome P450 [Marasmius fiardii PR-910]|nr:cytochrome P450 [Marasmius fiardii PR-910]